MKPLLLLYPNGACLLHLFWLKPLVVYVLTMRCRQDTIDKSHKFLVMHRYSASKPEKSIYEPKEQITIEKSHLEASHCVLDLDVPKRTLSLSSVMPGVRPIGAYFLYSPIRERLRE